MTREEHEKIADAVIDAYKDNEMGGKYAKAFNHGVKSAFNRVCKALEDIKKQQQPCEDMGEVSDGYHTFNQLYHQRAVLFATIVNQNKDKSWKSFKHSDGNYCFDRNGEWFIVGIDTPQGSYTYHYAKEYWDMFDCQELECGKEWDGHTEEDVTRLLSLQQQPCDDCISREDAKNLFWDGTEGYDCRGFTRMEIGEMLDDLPSVTPQPCEEENPNCTECRYYDHEKHHCPRFCHVIENTMAEITSEQTRPKGKWIDIGIAMEGRKYKNHECDMADAYCCDYCGYNQYIKTNYCPWCGAEMEGFRNEP